MTVTLEEVNNCYICESTKVEILMPARDRWHNLPGKFNIVQCKDCGLIYTNPRPTMESMASYYPNDYQPHQPGDRANRQSRVIKEKIKSVFKSLLNTRSYYLPSPVPGGRLLEIGCSYGSFLNKARNKGWEVYGVEIAEGPAKYGQETLGLNIYRRTLESAGFPGDFFDIVTGWMVLEHLHDPVGTIKEIRRIMKPGGTVAFSVPNAGSWEFKVFGTNWFALEVPRHLSHFTPGSIQHLLTRNGFELEKIYFQKNISNIPASLALCIEDRFSENFASIFFRNISFSNLFHKLTFPIAAVLSWFKMTGRMTVIGKVIK